MVTDHQRALFVSVRQMSASGGVGIEPEEFCEKYDNDSEENMNLQF